MPINSNLVIRFAGIAVLVASFLATMRLAAIAVEPELTPTRTPRPTRTATPTASPTTTAKVTTYVLSGDSRFDLYLHTAPPSISGPLVGSMDLVPRRRERGRVSEFDIRRLELDGGRYRFTARSGTVQMHWKNGRVVISMQAVLRIQPAPYGGGVVDRDFSGGASYFSRHPPDIRQLWISDQERVPRPHFVLLIVAEPAA